MARVKILRLVMVLLILLLFFFMIRLAHKKGESKSSISKTDSIPDPYWRGPDTSQIPDTEEGGKIRLWKKSNCKNIRIFRTGRKN